MERVLLLLLLLLLLLWLLLILSLVKVVLTCPELLVRHRSISPRTTASCGLSGCFFRIQNFSSIKKRKFSFSSSKNFPIFFSSDIIFKMSLKKEKTFFQIKTSLLLLLSWKSLTCLQK
jgi:hypothetical protein